MTSWRVPPILLTRPHAGMSGKRRAAATIRSSIRTAAASYPFRSQNGKPVSTCTLSAVLTPVWDPASAGIFVPSMQFGIRAIATPTAGLVHAVLPEAKTEKPSFLPAPGPGNLAGTVSSLRTDLKLSSVRRSGMLCIVSMKRLATG
jgi:hypothetical protein